MAHTIIYNPVLVVYNVTARTSSGPEEHGRAVEESDQPSGSGAAPEGPG